MSNGPCPHVAVLSDHRLLCEGLMRILGEDPSLFVAGYSDGDVLSDAVRSRNPNVVLLDSRAGGAFRTCAELTHAGIRVVMIAAPDNDDWASDALDSGARGIVIKAARNEDLFLAIHAVHDGQIWARRRVLAARIDRLTRATEPVARQTFFDDRLSVREAEVLRHAASGLGNKELADRLAITEATVKVHLTRIFQKLGLRGRNELAAAYHGLLPERRTPTR
jgi:two-component system, NarL family, nitrate/nitrite response regulator NarL